MGRYSANFKAEVQKGLIKGGIPEFYPVFEVALPSGPRRFCAKGVSSDVRGSLDPRISEMGSITWGIDLFTHELGEQTWEPTFDDADVAPSQRRLFAREKAKYPNLIRRSVVTGRMISPNVPDADSWPFFVGILDDAVQIAPMKWRALCRTDDGPLRNGKVPKVPILNYYPGADPAVLSFFAPILYGVHNSNGSGGEGFIPCYLVDPANGKYLLQVGRSNAVTGVYEEGTLVSTSEYSVVYETVKGALFTIIDFTSPRSGEITADVEGLTVNSDGTGGLITDPAAQLLHFLANFVFGDWRSGAYLSTPTMIDTTSLSAVGAFLLAMGYDGSFRIDGATKSGALDVLNGWLDSNGVYAWWDAGKITFGVLDHRPPATIYPTDVFIEGSVDELGGFETPYDPQVIQREVSVQYLPGKGQYHQTLKVADLSVAELVTAELILPWSRASLL